MTVTADLPADRTSSLAFGFWCGVTMAVGGSIAFVAARAGILTGLAPDDVIFARYLVAGLVMLPPLAFWGLPDLAGIGWRRGLILTIFGGAPFAMLQTAGFVFAPLAHGAVIAPSTVMIVSTIAAGVFLGETITRSHLAGAALVLGGIILIGWQGITGSTAGGTTWIGDLLFFSSSTCWAAFSVLIRKWQINAVRATAVIAVLSFVFFTPLYLAYRGPGHLSVLPFGPLVFQAAVQGLLQAIVGVMAFNRAITILGVSRAALFPASLPAISVLIGIPALGEIPSAAQIAGLATVSAGMLLAVGMAGRKRVDGSAALEARAVDPSADQSVRV